MKITDTATAAWDAALRVDGAARARGRGRALAQALVHLPYDRETNRRLAANARHVIREILADLRRGAWRRWDTNVAPLCGATGRRLAPGFCG